MFKYLVPSVLAVVLVLAWDGAIRGGLAPAFLLPPPLTVLDSLGELLADGSLARHTGVSVARLLVGYGLSLALALPVAFLLARVRLAHVALSPFLEFLRQVPPLAMMPLLILWLGIGEAQKVGIIVLACVFPVFLATFDGIALCDPKLVEVGRVSGLSERAILWRVVLPAALPTILIGARIALGQAWRALVGAELVASAAGLGYMIVDAETLARTDIVVAGILVIGTLGLVSDWAMRRAIGTFAPWALAERGADARL